MKVMELMPDDCGKMIKHYKKEAIKTQIEDQ